MRKLAWTTMVLVMLPLLACSGSGGETDAGADRGPGPDLAGDAAPPIDGAPDRTVLFTDGPVQHDLEPPDAAPPQPDGPPPQSATIQQITSGQIAAGTWVKLTGVTITAVDTGPPYTGDVYVQQGTGAGSGLRLYTPTRADGGQVADLSPGDQLSVTGQITAWAPSGGFPGGKTIQELVSGTVTLLGPGTAPAPTIVTPQQLTTEPGATGWEHVLVQVQDVKVTQPADSYGEFEVTGPLTVDDELHAHVPAVGDCLSITGISAYFYAHKLLPRGAADLQSSSGCAGPAALTIKDIQDETSVNHPAVGSQVTVTGVISAVDGTKNSYGDYEGFFIQEPAGGQYSGIYVYHKWTDASAQKPDEGQLVELTGTYQEYGTGGTVSELSNVSWTVTGTAAVPPPIVVAAADMVAGGVVAEAHEGVLIQVNAIKVGAYYTDSKGVQIGFADDPTGFLVIHKLYDFMAPPPPVGTTYSKIVGPLHFVVGTFEVMPRRATDMTP